MSGAFCHIAGVGLLGPGLPGWAASIPVLSGAAPWVPAETVLPPPPLLPPTERRRAGAVTRLALAAATEASAGLDAAALDTVFASSNGDGATLGAILEALTAEGSDVSPTQFHNSVHNAAAGYWGIGTHSMRPSVSLGGHDDVLPLGLLQAAAQCAAWGRPVLFCAYDAPLPPPLDACHPAAFPFAMALVLRPGREGGLAGLRLWHQAEDCAAPATRGALGEALEDGNPVARALPMLEALAAGRPADLCWPLLDGGAVCAALSPC
ncbi:beta-ketoacyl synthase chain length factor [Teichococcus oryzae]|uniref:Beta-ketoacyl synthase chain length factor n=1 Tax=Teichococcus oryzae TaxID=1608942 RepID=A0A5B2TH02_9PROT|nr:beta-ketoacyl synthase chain length factor [Pseudoroseomonas oryzae]KAA2213060.1 beta-ketoacyl synthase chain length factor [Pseudoroseomonas oryzae]